MIKREKSTSIDPSFSFGFANFWKSFNQFEEESKSQKQILGRGTSRLSQLHIGLHCASCTGDSQVQLFVAGHYDVFFLYLGS